MTPSSIQGTETTPPWVENGLGWGRILTDWGVEAGAITVASINGATR